MKPVTFVKQLIIYVLGLLFVSVGINFAKMSMLGISPVSSIPRACEVIWGFTLGTTTMIIYCLLVLLQIILLRKKFKIRNLLGIAITFVFSWLIDLTGIDPNAFGHLLVNFPRPENYIMQLVFEIFAIVLIGIGVFLYLRPRWVPMPAEGFSEALSEITGKQFGDCKTIVDTSMVVIALILQLVFMGGLSSFTSETVVVREGTILCAVIIGQVVKFLSKKFGSKMDKILDLAE